MVAKFEVFKDKAGKYRFRLKAANGGSSPPAKATKPKPGHSRESTRSRPMPQPPSSRTRPPDPAALLLPHYGSSSPEYRLGHGLNRANLVDRALVGCLEMSPEYGLFGLVGNMQPRMIMPAGAYSSHALRP